MNGEPQKRVYKRLKSDARVELYYLDEKKKSKKSRTRAADISSGGLLVVSKKTFDLGASVIAKFSLPGFDEPFDLIARVVRLDESEDGDYRIGLSFLDPEDERLDKIEEWVDSQSE